MKKIQEIKFNKYVELEPLIPMYCRGSVSILTVPDGSAKLKAGEGFDFLTYFNSFPLGKWRKYTFAENFFLVIDAVGKFDLDLVGHLPKESGHQKEWGGRFSYDMQDRQEIIIPIPGTMQSNLISFGINVYEDTYVYNAYYATDADKLCLNEPHITVVTNITDDYKAIYKNFEFLKNSIFCDELYKEHFSWVLTDKNGILRKEEIPKEVTILSDSNDFSAEGSHIVIADETIVFSMESFKRLYDFLCFVKDLYKEYEITGTILEEEKPNIQVDAIVNKEKNNDSVIDSLAKIHNTDLGIWSNIIDNESYATQGIYTPGLFYCIPSERFEDAYFKRTGNVNETGYGIFRDNDKTIRLSGICAWAPKLKERIEASHIENSEKKVLRLHDIVLTGEIEIEVTRNMYYRSNGKISLVHDTETNESFYSFAYGAYYDFFTYFNAFSLEKWEKYTSIDNVYLMLEAKGKFSVTLFGHFKSKVGFQKEWLGDYDYDLPEKERILIPYPRGMQSSLISFGLNAINNFRLYKASYVTETEKSKIKNPLISMVTTTFKKERFIERNIALMTDSLMDDSEYNEHFYWYIIDNGCSVQEPENLNKRIKIVPNKNVGGAGGFAKGQMESIRSDNRITHILFMDDDVVFIPDSFKKLCNFLKVVKDEYADYFVSGAMLKTGQPNIQHENTGWLNDEGNNESINTNFDLNLWDVIINNEEIKDNVPNRYAAFWFCCVPTTIATIDNLPLPVFFRGDDIEYSLRNNAKFITMNGLCIWHEGFEGRFSASLDFYLTVRNKIMLCAINPHLNDIDMIGNIEKNFWEEMRKYDYKGASFFLDAIEDYMKGPDFYRQTDGEANMKEKKAADNKLKPINPEICGKIDFGNLYFAEPLSDKDMEIYKTTFNCQDKEGASTKKYSGNVNEKLMYGGSGSNSKYKRKKIGVIPYGWGTWPSKVYKMDEVIAVDPANDTYVIYKKDEKEFKKLKERFEKLMKAYEKNGAKIIQAYQEARAELSDEKFWDNYLTMEGSKDEKEI